MGPRNDLTYGIASTTEKTKENHDCLIAEHVQPFPCLLKGTDTFHSGRIHDNRCVRQRQSHALFPSHKSDGLHIGRSAVRGFQPVTTFSPLNSCSSAQEILRLLRNPKYTSVYALRDTVHLKVLSHACYVSCPSHLLSLIMTL